MAVKLALIPEYSDYRYNVIFKAYKWDPQVEDQNTISKYALLIDRETALKLGALAEMLSEETMLMEETLVQNPTLIKKLGLPGKINKAIYRTVSYDRKNNVRLMRFDFHPTENGWAVSEVNSDVPGGLAEATILPQIAAKYFDGYGPGDSVGNELLKAFRQILNEDSTIAFVHATSYSDDRQVMEFLSDYFAKNGFNTILAAPDHLKWLDNKAFSIMEGQEREVDGIVRFFPLEWLTNLPVKSNWMGYFDCKAPSCNHPISILTQSKRLPLVWDKLGLKITTWKKFLPETKNPKEINLREDGWIYKPTLGRVGEGISIKDAITDKELKEIEKAAHRNSKDWVAQQMFRSLPLEAADGSYHICIGVFTVNGKSAGFYGRISPYPRIDARAQDIPILVFKEGDADERQN